MRCEFSGTFASTEGIVVPYLVTSSILYEKEVGSSLPARGLSEDTNAVEA